MQNILITGGAGFIGSNTFDLNKGLAEFICCKNESPD